MFLISLFCSEAKTSTARTDIENTRPSIVIISAGLNSNELTVRARISDPNGHEDIQGVGIKIVSVDETEQTYARFGNEYKEAALDSASGTEAVYEYKFIMDPNDEEGVYRVKVQVSDGESTVEGTADYSFPEGTMPTGALIGAPEMDVPGFFRKIFGFIKGLFA